MILFTVIIEFVLQRLKTVAQTKPYAFMHTIVAFIQYVTVPFIDHITKNLNCKCLLSFLSHFLSPFAA